MVMSTAASASRWPCVRCRAAPYRHRVASVDGLLCTGLFSHLLVPVIRLDSASRYVSSTTCSNLDSARNARLSQSWIHADHRLLTRPRSMLVFEMNGGGQQSICSCDGVPRPRVRPSPFNHLALTEIGDLISSKVCATRVEFRGRFSRV